MIFEVMQVTNSGEGKKAPAADRSDTPKVDRAAERARRQDANKAERAARQQARQAERQSRKQKAEAPAFVPAPAPKAAPAPDPTAQSQQFNILIVAQQGRLAGEAALFAASLRRNSPNWRGRLIVAEPQEDGAWRGARTRLDAHSRAVLTALGAEITPFTAQHFGSGYPYGNKIEALALLPEGQPFVFFDSDTLVTGPLDRVAFDFSRPSASMRRSGSWPQPPLYGPGFGDIWKSLYDRFDLDFASSLAVDQPDEHWERYLYFNAGWFFGPDPREFARRFLGWSLAIRAEPGEALACQSLDPWLDQITLPLVIHSLGGGRPGPELAGLDGAVTCHYRNFSLLYAREPDAVVDLLELLVKVPEIAALFATDEAVQRLVGKGEGRQTVRRMFADVANMTEKPIRQRLKQAGYWFH